MWERKVEEIAGGNWSGIEVILAEKSSSHVLITVRYSGRERERFMRNSEDFEM